MRLYLQCFGGDCPGLRGDIVDVTAMGIETEEEARVLGELYLLEAPSLTSIYLLQESAQGIGVGRLRAALKRGRGWILLPFGGTVRLPVPRRA